MGYINNIEGYVCERCGYRWAASRNGTGLRPKQDPSVCAKCKSPYWNKPRKNNLSPDRWANRWARQNHQDAPPE